MSNTTELPQPDYIIIYEDAEVPMELFFDEDVALARHELVNSNWNCHLFSRHSLVRTDQQEEIDALKAHVEMLRFVGEKLALSTAAMFNAVNSTPTQSLATHENKLIDEMAKVCDALADVSLGADDCAAELRNMKREV